MCTRCAFLGGLAAVTTSGAQAAPRKGDPQALEIAMPHMRRISDTMWLGQLTPNVWIHTTTHVLDGVGYYPANGAIVIDGRTALLIDTGWNDADARTILSAWVSLRQPPITKALVTHFHFDRVGGIGELSKRGIPAFGNPLTIGLALDAGNPVPRPLHELEKRRVRCGGVEAFYPGAGHTIDNVVAWVPSDGVLFAGCLVKSRTAPDLGNVADGDLVAYPRTIRRLIHDYAPRHVIPGHGTISGDPLAHTLTMALAAAPNPQVIESR
jgi:glyoxylase-like metal-dependent hydrolase (beta-lactamase superfamily II)